MCTTRFCVEAAWPLSEPASLEVFLASGDIEPHDDNCGSSLLNIFIVYRVTELHDSIDFFVVMFKIFNLIIMKSHGTRVFFYYVFELSV